MVLSRVFSEHDLKYLDPASESTEEYLRQEHHIQEVHNSQGSVEAFHGFSEFRTKGEIRNALEHYQRHPEALEHDVVIGVQPVTEQNKSTVTRL